MSKLVIFDIDRTIYNGSIFLDFSLHLIQKEKISPKFLSSIGFEFFTYQTGFESYDELIRDCLTYFYDEIKILNPTELKEEIRECLIKNHHKFYDYFFKTIKTYSDYDYILISLEPDFIVSEIAKFTKIENFVANKFMENNEFIKKLSLIYDKNILLSQTNFKGVKPFAAFGDSESDLGILLDSSNQFIINPTSKLQREILEKKLNLKFYDQNNIFEDIVKIF